MQMSALGGSNGDQVSVCTLIHKCNYPSANECTGWKQWSAQMSKCMNVGSTRVHKDG